MTLLPFRKHVSRNVAKVIIHICKNLIEELGICALAAFLDSGVCGDGGGGVQKCGIFLWRGGYKECGCEGGAMRSVKVLKG